MAAHDVQVNNSGVSKADAALYLIAAKPRWQFFPVWGVTDGACDCGRPDCGSPGKHPVQNGWRDDANSDLA